MKRYLSAAAICLFLAACSSNPMNIEIEPAASASVDVRANVGSAFQVRAGEVAELDSGNLRIAFRGVSTDSRCPEDVTCVWAGDAALTLGVSVGGADWEWVTVHTAVDPRVVTRSVYALSVVSLSPATRQSRAIEQRDYVAELRVERA